MEEKLPKLLNKSQLKGYFSYFISGLLDGNIAPSLLKKCEIPQKTQHTLSNYWSLQVNRLSGALSQYILHGLYYSAFRLSGGYLKVSLQYGDNHSNIFVLFRRQA